MKDEFNWCGHYGKNCKDDSESEKKCERRKMHYSK